MAHAFTLEERREWLKTQSLRASSAAVLVHGPDGRIISVKASYKNFWSIPGGMIDAGETPKEAAIREVEEEIGIMLDPDDVHFYAVLDRKSDDEQTYQFIFTAKTNATSIADLQLQTSEISEAVFISKDEVLSSNKQYSRMLQAWASTNTSMLGYVEQDFDWNNG